MVEATQQTQIKTLEDPFEKKMIEVFGPLLNPPTCQGTPRVKAQQTFATQVLPRTGRQKGRKVDNTVQPLQRISITLANTSGFQVGCIARFRGKHQCHARINRQKIWSDKV